MHRRVLRSPVNFRIARIISDNCNGIARRAASDAFHGRRGSSFAREKSSSSSLIQYGSEVEEARNAGAPIVALESTIITHGMPYPDNLDTALRVEEIIREQGAVPATIAIFDGRLQVGMGHERLEKLAKCAGETRDERTIKCSRRDISTAISRRLNGGTTVGGTMTIARMAGIPIMATGGIGGVHRGAEVTMDVSSDLIELSRNPVAVVCAGVKAILDIPKTLEYLETQGVPVVTIGETDNFPAFYSRETSPSDPAKAPSRVSNSREAAELLRAQQLLALNTGVLFAVPIPESHALDSTSVESTIREALATAEANGIRGRNVTPYLLGRLNQLTSGGFLKANQALVENNARVAAEIAVALSRSRGDKGTPATEVQQPSGKPPPAVIGGATIDVVLHVDHPQIKLDGRTHRARSRESHGGVGRNVAAALVSLGLENTRLITVVGADAAGRAIAENLGEAAEDIELLSNAVTPRYTAVLDKNGECRFGVGDMETFAAIDANFLLKHRSTIESAGILVVDGNVPLETMRAGVEIAARNGIPVWYEPTDVSKATLIFESASEWINVDGGSGAEESALQFISPNVNELVAIAKYLGIQSQSDESTEDLSIERISKLAKGLAERVPVVITTLGSRGLLVTRRGPRHEPFFNPARRLRETARHKEKPIQSRWYPAPKIQKRDSEENFSVSGCGDCLAAAIITGSYRGLSETECASFALEAAAVSLRSYEPVPRTLIDLRNFSALTNVTSPRTID